MDSCIDSCDQFWSESEAIDHLLAHYYSSLLTDVLNRFLPLYTQTSDEKLVFAIECLLNSFIEGDQRNETHHLIRAVRDRLVSMASAFGDISGTAISLERRHRREYFLNRMIVTLETESTTLVKHSVDSLLAKLALIDYTCGNSEELLHLINNCNWEKVISIFERLISKNPYINEFVTMKLVPVHSREIRIATVLRQCLSESCNYGSNYFAHLLNSLPDEELKEMEDCDLKDVLSMFPWNSNIKSDDLSSYYAAIIGRSTCKLSNKLSDLQWIIEKSKFKDINLYINEESKIYKVESCFLTSVVQKTHFLNKIVSVDLNLFNLIPDELKIIYLLDKLYYLSTAHFDTTEYLSLMTKLQEIISPLRTFVDVVIETLVRNLKWIFKLIDWSAVKLSTSNSENHQIKMFQTFASCGSPLNVLHRNSGLNPLFFSCDIEALDEISSLLADYKREEELMIWYGYMAVKLIMNCVVSGFTQEKYEQILNQIKDFVLKLFPLTFRVEILENLFSILFVTFTEIDEKDFDADCDVYNDESNPPTTKNTSEFGEQVSFQNTGNQSSVSLTTSTGLHTSAFVNFLFPSELVPRFLTLLKDAVIETQTSLFILQRSNTIPEQRNIDGKHKICVNSSVTDLNDCKIRLNLLEGYITEAQWRYVVIEPTFMNKSQPKNCEALESTLNDVENEKGKDIDIENVPSTYDFGLLHQKEVFSSVIPCMLASPDQLLRYCLIERKIDKAKEVYQLFDESLKNTEEAYELLVIDKYEDLSSKLKLLTTKRSLLSASNASSHALEKSEIDALLYGLHLMINSETGGKVDSNRLSIDFALTSSPSLLLSRLILDESCVSSNLEDGCNLCDKLNSLLSKISTIILSSLESIGEKELSIILAYSLEDIFTNPATIRGEEEKNKELNLCLDYLKKVLFDSNEVYSQTASKVCDSRRVINEYQKLVRFCPAGKYSYLNALLLHTIKVSKALVDCKKRCESFTREDVSEKDNFGTKRGVGTSFSVLYDSPSVTLCSMILKHGISPKIVDDLAKDMRVDLIETLCSLHSPPIPATVKDDLDFELVDSCHPALCELIHCYLTGSQANNESVIVTNHFEDDSENLESNCKHSEKISSEELIEYFHVKSWILVEVLGLLKLLKLDTLSKIRGQFIIRPNAPLCCWMSFVSDLLDSGSKEDPVMIKALAFHPKIPASHYTTMKSLEKLAQRKDLVKMYELLRLVDSRNPSSSLVSLRTAILSKLTIDTQNIKFALQVDDFKTKCDLIYNTLLTSDLYCDPNVASRALRSISSVAGELQTSIPAFVELQLLMDKVVCYTKIAELAGLRSWKEALNSLLQIDIITILKTRKAYSLALEWNALHSKIEKSDVGTEELRLELLFLAYCEKKDFFQLENLFKTSYNCVHLVEKTLPQIEEWASICFLVSFILKNGFLKGDEQKLEYYKKYMRGITLINTLPLSCRSLYIPLCTEPSLIAEQMLMNLEFDALEKSVKSLQLIECDELLEKYAKKAVDIEIVDNISLADSDTTMISSSILNDNTNTGFVMPAAVPTVEQWIPDNRVSYCMHCRVERFSMFNRRHHCRRCGRVVCANCSRSSLIIPEVSLFVSVRVCDDCFTQMKLRSPRKESMSSLSSSTKTLQWVLTLSEQQNEAIREEFFYESAPSSSLCLSILKLHTNNRKCAAVIIDKFCKPLFEILSSNQVDYGLVINTIKSLLISAKVLVTDDDSSSVNKINVLLARLDIIKMLVNENCLDRILISCVINDENAFLKLQEKLIEMERFELALNIAMKFGINLKPIWKTWAVICLKNLKFAEARTKFKHCFNKKTKGEANATNSKLLDEIFEILEKISCRSVVSSVRGKCNSIKAGKISMNDYTSPTLKSCVMQEAFYYLESYGSKEDVVKFYLRFECYRNVIETFAAEINPTALTPTFISAVLIPLLNKGCLNKFLGTLHSLDPTLSRSWKYLLAACKYLSQNNYYIVLHSLQIFMGDYIRAAVTQINYFYLHPPATSYNEFYQRRENLTQAKHHCRDFLSNMDNMHKCCFYMSAVDVRSQIRTIDMQLEISSKFHEKGIHGYDEISHELQEIESKYTKSPPTLLDHSKARKTLLTALVVVEGGSSIIEGFTLSQQIISDHGLDAAQVYRYSGKIILRLYNVDVLSEFLGCVRASLTVEESASFCDDVVGACIRSCSDTRQMEQLIKLLSSDMNKIDAYILCNKLKSAYLLAVKLERVTDVKRIHSLAIRSNQEKVRQICEAFLVKFKNL